MTRLSVNINKIAVLRNSRGGNIPDLLKVAQDCEAFGAEGITVHPRPDERHIRYQDVYDLAPLLTTEFNIEGYPSEKFLQMIEEVQPTQCTLVPDDPGVLTSDNGWNTIEQQDFLKDVVKQIQSAGVRVSLFVNADPKMVEAAASTGAERIELYTGPYAHLYTQNRDLAVAPYIKAAEAANAVGLGINAGHDLNLENLRFFAQSIPGLLEVSIGHALISDALYYGLQNVIMMYRRLLQP